MFAACLADRAEAQTGPGPTPTAIPWPFGGHVPAVFANDGVIPLQFEPCQPLVKDASGTTVFIGFCLPVIQILHPGDVGVMYWPQVTTQGTPVAPGIYDVEGVLYDIGAAEAGLVPLGRPFLGATRSFFLTAPSQPNAPYVLAASASANVGVPLGCGRAFPIDFDALTLLSLSGAPFGNFIGTLNSIGETSTPSLAMPFLPSLVGLDLYFAFLTVNQTAPCGIGVISDALKTQVI